MKSRMKFHKWINCLILFTAAAAALSWPKGVLAGEKQEGRLELSVRYGFNQTVLYQCHIPVTVTVQNHGEGFSGRLQLIVTNDGRNNMVYEQAVELPAGETKEILFSFYTDNFIPEMTLKLLDSSGSAAAERRISLVYGNQENIYMGAVSNGGGDPDAFSYLKGEGRNLMTLSPGQLPALYTELDMLDVLIMGNIGGSMPDTEQTEAVNKWVLNGGTLVLGSGVAESRVFDKLCGKPGTEFLPVGTGGIRKAGIGKGVVLLIPYELEEAVRKEIPEAGMLGEIITRNISHAARVKKEENGGYSRQMTALEELLWSGDKGIIPSVGKYGIVFGVYVLLAGPGLYLALKKKDRRTHYWTAVLLLSGGFCLLIFAMGTETRRSRPSVRYVSYVTASEDGEAIGKETWFSVIAPGKRQYRLPGDWKWGAYPANSYGGYFYSTAEAARPTGRITLKNNGEQEELDFDNCAGFRPVYFRTVQPADGKMSIRQQLVLEDFALTGSITNNTGMDITDAFILKDNVITSLGDLPDGAAAQADGKEDVKLHSVWELYSDTWETAGLIKYGTKDPGADNGRYYALRNYLIKECETGKECFLIGFTGSSCENTVWEDGTADVKGETLVVLPMEIPSFFEGKEAVADILSYPHSIDGDYFAGVNERLLSGSEVTITYRFGEDSIDTLYYLPEWNPDCREDVTEPKETSWFSGTVSIYDWNSKSFLPLFTGGEPGEKKLSDENFSGSDEITLKFTPDKVENEENTFSIPVISAVKGAE